MFFQKIILVICICITTISADFVDDYDNGKYAKSSRVYYALGESSVNNNNYRQFALLDAKRSLASQLLSVISAYQSLYVESKQIDGVESISQKFTNYYSLDVTNLPVLGEITINRMVKDHKYYILLKFDFDVASSIYTSETNRLVKEIDDSYTFYSKTNQITLKQKILKKLKNLHENYQIHFRVCSLLKEKCNKPKVSMATIDQHLFELYNQETSDIVDLSKILVSRLALEKVHGALEILPIGFEEKFHTTKFSHRLKHLLQNELYNKVEVTKAVFTPYKLIGTYTLEKNTLQIHVMIVDSEAKVMDSAVAMMKVKDRNLFKEHSLMQASPNQPYSIMEDYFDNW